MVREFTKDRPRKRPFAPSWRLHLALSCAQVVLFSTASIAGEAPAEIIFGGDSSYPPFEWSERGRARGFNIELETKIAELGDAEPVHRLAAWPETVRALEAGEVDIVPMFYSPERAEKFYFSIPFYQLNHVAYSRPSTKDIVSVINLENKTVAVEATSFAHDEIVRADLPVSLVLTENTLGALRAVISGRADYALLASAAADELIRRHALDLERSSPPMWPRSYSFAVRKDRESIARWLDESFHLLIAEGYYGEIFSRWESELEPKELAPVDVILKAGYVIVPLLALTTFGFLWSWMLRRQVATRTSELTTELGKRQVAEQGLRYLAEYDEQTGFPKFNHYIELADAFLRGNSGPVPEETECVVLRLMELFSVVRVFGYSAGDHFVRDFAARLRDLDFHVYGHLGQGVFVFLAPKGAMVDNWQRITSPLEVDELTLSPNPVAGIAHWPEHAPNATQLLRAAELSLAVTVKRNLQWMQYEASMEPDPEDLKIVASFRQQGEKGLHAVYQPQLAIDSRSVEAVESLVRWRHPNLGPIPPGRFVPLLENAGLITLVTVRMIDDAFRMWALISKKGFSCKFSVNVAARDLLLPDFMKNIREAARRHGAKLNCLKLELTETSLAEATDDIIHVLEPLRADGIRIAIDDFGTGYSSLSYLSAFPVDELKIDRTFVSNMLTSARDRSIVRSTISLAHELKLNVVAEGAEDQATIDALKEDGCDIVQGYGISRPLPEHDLVEFLKHHQ